MASSPVSFKQRAEYLLGDRGQRLVAELLKDAGWYVLPSYDYSGSDGNKAPRMEGRLASFCVPDLDCAKAAKRVWVEVKTKTRPTFTRLTGQDEHGIPLRHLEHYRRIEAETGTPVYLVIYELCSQSLLSARLTSLGTGRLSLGSEKYQRGGMVYFPRDAFRLWRH